MRAVLDACVLYPTVMRGLLLDAAKAGFFEPFWSERLLEEWARAAARTHGQEGEQQARVEVALLRAEWPKAELECQPLPDLPDLPDENDRHVLETAVTAKADTLITLNLRDFPTRRLSPLGIAPRHPDAVLRELWEEVPEKLENMVASAFERVRQFDNSPATPRAMLKKAHLPRLGKAMQNL